MAEAHPVGFQWVMEAKARGAKIIHIDPRFSRTSAMADMFVPVRAGADIAFVGGLVNYVLTHEKYFHDYVLNYTNASVILSEDYADTEDLDGVFSGLDREHKVYDPDTWRYEGFEAEPASGARGAVTRGVLAATATRDTVHELLQRKRLDQHFNFLGLRQASRPGMDPGGHHHDGKYFA